MCEEGQHSECYTNTSWGVAILTLWKCYLDLTIKRVALTLPEGCFDTLVSIALTLPEGCFDTLVTPSKGRTDTFMGYFDTIMWWVLWKLCGCRVKHCMIILTLCEFRVTHCKRFFLQRCVFTVRVHGITVNSKRFVLGSHIATGGCICGVAIISVSYYLFIYLFIY